MANTKVESEDYRRVPTNLSIMSGIKDKFSTLIDENGSSVSPVIEFLMFKVIQGEITLEKQDYEDIKFRTYLKDYGRF